MKRELTVHRAQSILYMIRQLKQYKLKMLCSILTGIMKEAGIIAAAGLCAYMAACAKKGLPLNGTPLLWILAGLVLVRGVTTYLESYLSHDVAYHALVDYRVRLFDRFIGQCPVILLKNRSGQIATTIMNDVEQLEWFYGHTVGYVVVVIVVCLAILGFLLWLHPLLALLAMAGMALILVVPMLMKGKADAQGMACRHRLGEANSVTLEGINGMNEILTLNWKERYQEKNSAYMDALTDAQVEYAKRMGSEGGLLQCAAGISAVAINLAGIWLTLSGKLALEYYAVVGTSVWLAFNPLLTICGMARTFGTVFAASERVMDLLVAEPVLKNVRTEPSGKKLDGDIVFEHVGFGYDAEGTEVLHDVNLRIAKGEFVAIAGESGAGKTTCVNLLARFWDVRSGSIRIGDTDIRELSLKELRDHIAVVSQDIYLFNTSIRDNIRIGRPDASDDEIVDAAKKAEIHDFILSLPQGYDTFTGEQGVKMSGGQRQRIAIARAVLKNAPVLVLDEAVSSLDTQTDLKIQKTIRSLSREKTVILVAHRLATITDADRLVVMKNGRVIQQGTFEELNSVAGEFRTLFAAQTAAEPFSSDA